MAHSIPELIVLEGKFNKLIRKGMSNKEPSPKPSQQRRGKGRDAKRLYGGMADRSKSTMTTIDGKRLDKPIQVYRMWYRFLQLALELEDQGVHIVTKTESRELKTPKKDAWGKLRYSERVPIKKKIKVNRKKYDGWDLDSIPTTSFDDWWEGDGKNYPPHREMFYPDTSVVVLKKQDEWVEDRNFTYIRIDNRRRINDIEKDIRGIFAEQQRKIENVTQYPIFGTPNINTLINRYNALILQLTTQMKDKEMLSSPYFRPTRLGMGEDPDQADEQAYNIGDRSPGSVMRDLMHPAKIALLSVCDGYFVENPNKSYL